MNAIFNLKHLCITTAFGNVIRMNSQMSINKGCVAQAGCFQQKKSKF